MLAAFQRRPGPERPSTFSSCHLHAVGSSGFHLQSPMRKRHTSEQKSSHRRLKPPYTISVLWRRERRERGNPVRKLAPPVRPPPHTNGNPRCRTCTHPSSNIADVCSQRSVGCEHRSTPSLMAHPPSTAPGSITFQPSNRQLRSDHRVQSAQQHMRVTQLVSVRSRRIAHDTRNTRVAPVPHREDTPRCRSS